MCTIKIGHFTRFIYPILPTYIRVAALLLPQKTCSDSMSFQVSFTRWYECLADLPPSMWLQRKYIEFGGGPSPYFQKTRISLRAICQINIQWRNISNRQQLKIRHQIFPFPIDVSVERARGRCQQHCCSLQWSLCHLGGCFRHH